MRFLKTNFLDPIVGDNVQWHGEANGSVSTVVSNSPGTGVMVVHQTGHDAGETMVVGVRAYSAACFTVLSLRTDQAALDRIQRFTHPAGVTAWDVVAEFDVKWRK